MASCLLPEQYPRWLAHVGCRSRDGGQVRGRGQNTGPSRRRPGFSWDQQALLLCCVTLGKPVIASFTPSVWGEGTSLQHSIKLSRVDTPWLANVPDNSSCGKRTITMGSNHGSSKSNVSVGNLAHLHEPR